MFGTMASRIAMQVAFLLSRSSNSKKGGSIILEVVCGVSNLPWQAVQTYSKKSFLLIRFVTFCVAHRALRFGLQRLEIFK